MIDLQQLIQFSDRITQDINNCDSIFLDGISPYISMPVFWIPVILVAIYVIFRDNNSHKLIWMLSMQALAIACCIVLATYVIKPFLTKQFPDPSIFGITIIPFCLVTFLFLSIRSAFFTFSSILWMITYSWARVYNGESLFVVLLFCIFTGLLIGALFYMLYRIFVKNNDRYSSSHAAETLFTSSGYQIEDIRLIQCTFYSTFLVIIFISLF